MNSSIYRFTLDMHSTQSQISIPATLGDTNRKLYISFTDGGNPYKIADGCLAQLSIKRPTGTFLVEFCAIEKNTTVIYDFMQNENTCAVEGLHDCDITLYDAQGKRITSPRFALMVSEKAVNSDDINISDEDSLNIDTIVKAEQSRQAAETVRINSEATRIDAEKQRAEAEEARNQAEALRLSSGERAEQAVARAVAEADRAEEAADRAAADATEAAEAEVTRLVGEIGVVQTMGDSPVAAMSQKATSAELRRVSKRITNLEQGLPEDNFVTDSTVAYVKDVPSTALPYAEVKKIGGMTYKDGNTLKSAKVTEIESVGTNLFSPLIKGVGLNSSTGAETTDNGGASTDYIRVDTAGGGDYCLSGMPYNLFSFIAFYDKNKNFVERTGAGIPSSSSISLLSEMTKANVNPTTIAYIRITVYENSNVSGEISSVDNLQIMLNKGSTDLPYAPYHCDILSIPKEVQVENGINDEVYDFIEWGKDGKSKRNIRVGKVDLGTLSWQFLAQASDGSQIYYSTSLGGFTHFSSNNSLCGEFSLMSHSSAEELKHGEYMTYGIGDSEVIAVAAKDYTDAATFKAAMSGVMLYYELATPEITDISDKLTADNYIGIESGGTITAVNEHGLAVPSEIEYQVEV